MPKMPEPLSGRGHLLPASVTPVGNHQFGTSAVVRLTSTQFVPLYRKAIVLEFPVAGLAHAAILNAAFQVTAPNAPPLVFLIVTSILVLATG